MNRTNTVYTVQKLAEELKISRRTVLRAIRNNELKTAKFSPTVFRIEGEDVDDWLESLKRRQEDAPSPTTTRELLAWEKLGFKSKELWEQWKKTLPCKICSGSEFYTNKKGTRICSACTRRKSLESREENPDRARINAARHRSELTDSYIAGTLDMPVQLLRDHPELIEAKREQLQISRTLKPTRKKKQHAPESQ